MFKHLIQAVFLVSLATTVSIPLAAQNGTSVQTKGQKSKGASQQDQNVKNDNPINVEGQTVPAPPNKGGPKPKGETCEIHIDNKTAYYIRIYLNGDMVGMVGPWGDLYPDITWGSAQLYGRAVFDDGSVTTFGPRDYQCTGQPFHWTLTY